ncbi:MAG: GreA/GreB family elongation factor [Candidatus Wildermuthbacteria bacterium]|nr:GreA/GreB family elongation factor [Candidatus Wildermuthbacteria bacterium]
MNDLNEVVSKNCRVRISGENNERWLCYEGVPPKPGDSTMTLVSPLGKALLGKRVGDRVTVNLPLATRTVTIEEIEDQSTA